MGAERSCNFFIRHLPENDPRRSQSRIFQIQIVDRYGLATAFAYLGEDDVSLVVDAYPVPDQVLTAARTLKPGGSRFIDSSGNGVLPKNLPLSGI